MDRDGSTIVLVKNDTHFAHSYATNPGSFAIAESLPPPLVLHDIVGMKDLLMVLPASASPLP